MIKKKKKKHSEEESSAVKFSSTSMKAAKDKKKEEDERKTGSNVNRLKLSQGRSFLWVLPPINKEMNGLPTVDKMMHNNLGPEGDQWGPCQRISLKQPREDCKACVFVNSLWDKTRVFKKKGKLGLVKKYETMAKAQGAKVVAVSQVLDVSGAYDKTGKIVDEFPKCFGENLNSEEEKYPKCRKCTFLNSCQKGVQKWDMQYGIYRFMMDKFSEEEIDICNPQKAFPLKIIRKGEDLKTKYTTELAQSIQIPAHVIDFAEKHAINLPATVKPSDDRLIMKMLTGGGEMPDTSSDEKVKKDEIHLKKAKPTVTKEQKEDMKRRLMEKMKAKKLGK